MVTTNRYSCLASVCAGIWVMQKGAKKAYRRSSLILSLVCVLIFGAFSSSLAAWEDRTCVFRNEVTFRFLPPGYEGFPVGMSEADYVFYSWQQPTGTNNLLLGVRYTSKNIIPFGYITPYPAYFYFDPTRRTASYPNGQWLPVYWGADFYMRFDPSFADSWNAQSYPVLDVTKQYPNVLNQLYPNGCSALPSQQPDQTSNPDPGKPECNNQVL